jgi:hypothetical protein
MLRLVSLVFLLCLPASAINAQQIAQSTPSQAEARARHDRVAAAHVVPFQQFEQIAPYWTAESGWHTELQLRNNLAGESLTVRPFLRMSDGVETELKPVTLLHGEVLSINLMDALTEINSNLMGRADAYGSIALRYQAKSMRNLYASVMVHDNGHPIMYHLDANNQAPGYISGSREGIWWLPTQATKDYLILTNQGGRPLQGTLWLYDAVGTGWSQPMELGARQTLRLSVKQLLAKAGITGQYGGIKIDMPNGAGSLDSTHIVYDEVSGFSATMKMFDYDPRAKISEHDFAGSGLWTTRAPMLALRNPDPALALPAKVVLHPMVLIRNTTQKPIKARLDFHWRNEIKDGHSIVPEFTLAPFESKKIDVEALQSWGAIPLDARWAQVSLTTDSLPHEVMAVAASYDVGLRYGAQTPFSDQLIAHLEGGQWQVDATHTSILAAGNGGNKPVEAALTFIYDQGRKQYQLEQTIAANDQWWVNVGQLIRNQIPDKNGNTLPAGLTFGTYQLREISQPQLDLLYEGKVITDKTYGHATYGCMICCGFSGAAFGVPPYLLDDPEGVDVSSTAYMDAYGTNACSGIDQLVDSYYANWYTEDTSIMTAAPYAVTGVAPGSTRVHAYATSLPAGDGAAVERGQSCPLTYIDTSAVGTAGKKLPLIASYCAVNGSTYRLTGGWGFFGTTCVLNDYKDLQTIPGGSCSGNCYDGPPDAQGYYSHTCTSGPRMSTPDCDHFIDTFPATTVTISQPH